LFQSRAEQSRALCNVLEQSELIATPLPLLCELVLMLRRVCRGGQ